MASGAIKGITVEIGGDTTKLGKAIGDSEKKSRSLQVELRQIEKLLQFDPTNTELLIQKQTVLSNMIAETSKKLDTMKEAETQVVAQFERGEIGEEQLRAFQRELMQTEKSLNDISDEYREATRNLVVFGDNNGTAKAEAAKLEKEIQEQNDALEAEKKALQEAEKAQKDHEKAVEDAKNTVSDFKEKVGDMAENVGKGALAIGGAAMAGAGYALNLSNEFDKAYNTLATKTGASTREMRALNEAMEAVYANNFGESIEDVAESMATVRNNTKLSGKELQNATERALLLRDTFEFDVNESTRSAKMLMDQYGLSAEEAYNLIAQGAQSGLDKNGDLLDTINEYAVHFKSLGYTSEEMFNMLVNGAENGTFSVDKLGDAVKEFGIRAKDGTAADALKEYRKSLGLSTKDVKRLSSAMAAGGEESKNAMQEVVASVFAIEDPVKRNTVGVQLFGTMWEDLGEEGVKALMNVEGEISTTSDALDEINEKKYDDIGSALQGLGRTLEVEVVKPLGEELQPVVEDAIEYVQANAPQIKQVLSDIVTKIGEFVGFIVNNGDTIISVIAGIGTGMLVWNVATMITSVVSAIKAFKLANEGATIAQALFNAVLNANPIVLLVTVISAVVAAIVTFIATNDEARAKFLAIWGSIKSGFSSVISSIVQFCTVTIPSVFSQVVVWVQTNWQSILLFLINPFAGLFNYFYNNNGKFKEFVDNAVAHIRELPGKIWVWLLDTIAKVGTWGAQIWSTASTWVSNLVNTVATWFGQLPGKVWTWLLNVISRVTTWGAQLLAKARTTATNFVNSVVNFIRQLPGKIWTWLSNVISRVATWGSNLLARGRTVATTFVTSIISYIQQLPGKIWTWLTNAASKVVSWGTSLAAKGKQAAAKLLTTVVQKVKEIPGKLVSVGSDIVKGLWNGISNMAGWIKDKISGFGDGVLNALKNFFGIASPSRLMRDEVGRYIAEGIGVGIERNSDKPLDALKSLGEDMANQDLALNGATINRKLATTFAVDAAAQNAQNAPILSALNGIYERLNRMQIVLDTGVLVGETIDKIDVGLANKQLLNARGV